MLSLSFVVYVNHFDPTLHDKLFYYAVHHRLLCQHVADVVIAVTTGNFLQVVSWMWPACVNLSVEALG